MAPPIFACLTRCVSCILGGAGQGAAPAAVGRGFTPKHGSAQSGVRQPGRHSTRMLTNGTQRTGVAVSVRSASQPGRSPPISHKLPCGVLQDCVRANISRPHARGGGARLPPLAAVGDGSLALCRRCVARRAVRWTGSLHHRVPRHWVSLPPSAAASSACDH